MVLKRLKVDKNKETVGAPLSLWRFYSAQIVRPLVVYLHKMTGRFHTTAWFIIFLYNIESAERERERERGKGGSSWTRAAGQMIV